MTIRNFLASGAPLLFDGAMGTYFAAQPGRTDERCELACLTRPDTISAIHTAYLEAGARAIKTNTFSVSVDVAQGEDAQAARLIAAASRLAQEAAAPFDAFVFADLGPAPQGSLPAGEVYCRQIDLFLQQGLTCFVLETLPGEDGVAEAARHLKAACPEAFLLVSFAVDPEGFTREGRSGAELFRHAAALPQVDAVGFNCVSGPRDLHRFLQQLDLGGTRLPIAVLPNAGYPTVLGRRTVYKGQPDYFAQKLTDLIRAGASIVGGCCGTTPDHIAASAAALRQPIPRQPRPRVPLSAPTAKPRPADANLFWDKLNSGKRVIAVELDPPKDDLVQPFLEGAKVLAESGADLITIADCPIGRPRADSSLLACKLKRELGIEPLPHMTCRDRNLNAIKALLLGLSMEGVHNVLTITGDPLPAEDRAEVKAVFNFNSRKLAAYISRLNTDTLSTPMRVFGALNVNARNFDVQLRLAKEKEANGVCGFLTQPVLSAAALENLKRARAELSGKILGGIFPVVSYKNACFLNNEVSGVFVCDEISELYRDKDRAACEDIAVAVSAQVGREIAPYVDGFYLMTPFRRVELMQRIMEQLHGLDD